jgi:hypothetical protein
MSGYRLGEHSLKFVEFGPRKAVPRQSKTKKEARSESVPPWGFYVYFLGGFPPEYIGKGSGSRLRNQIVAHQLDGCEFARCRTEDDALRLEHALICEFNPPRNKIKGSSGKRRTKREDADLIASISRHARISERAVRNMLRDREGQEYGTD